MTRRVKQGWHRRKYSTRGADPTIIVEWEFWTLDGHQTIRVTEFQGVYQCNVEGWDEKVAKQLHDILENNYQREQEFKELMMSDYDIEPDYESI